MRQHPMPAEDQRIVDQDQQKLTDPDQVGIHANAAVQIGAKLDAALLRHGRGLDDQPFDDLVELHRPGIEAQLPRVGQGKRGQIAHDPVQLLDLLDDALRVDAGCPIRAPQPSLRDISFPSRRSFRRAATCPRRRESPTRTYSMEFLWSLGCRKAIIIQR